MFLCYGAGGLCGKTGYSEHYPCQMRIRSCENVDWEQLDALTKDLSTRRVHYDIIRKLIEQGESSS